MCGLRNIPPVHLSSHVRSDGSSSWWAGGVVSYQTQWTRWLLICGWCSTTQCRRPVKCAAFILVEPLQLTVLALIIFVSWLLYETAWALLTKIYWSDYRCVESSTQQSSTPTCVQWEVCNTTNHRRYDSEVRFCWEGSCSPDSGSSGRLLRCFRSQIQVHNSVCCVYIHIYIPTVSAYLGREHKQFIHPTVIRICSTRKGMFKKSATLSCLYQATDRYCRYLQTTMVKHKGLYYSQYSVILSRCGTSVVGGGLQNIEELWSNPFFLFFIRTEQNGIWQIARKKETMLDQDHVVTSVQATHKRLGSPVSPALNVRAHIYTD